MKNRNGKGTKIWNSRIATYRLFAKRNKGFLPEVLVQAARLYPGIEWTRAHVHYWLNPVEASGGEPTFGNGTILLQACEAAKIAMELKKAGA